MNFSAGHLHSSNRLIELLAKSNLNIAKVLDHETLLVSPIHEIINLSQKANWIEMVNDGCFCLTERGKYLLAVSNYEEKLRLQLKDIIIAFHPPWSKTLAYGRKEFRRYVPRNVSQCFDEAGLFQIKPCDAIVQWWDELTIISRSFRNSELLEYGRLGERKTIVYETLRTNAEPFWQSLESNFSGFDVLSIVSSTDSTPLQIEVKTSTSRLKEAKIHLTANEWKNALLARYFRFYLWNLTEISRLAIIEINDMVPHIPQNNGNGSWESLEIPMIIFKNNFYEVKE